MTRAALYRAMVVALMLGGSASVSAAIEQETSPQVQQAKVAIDIAAQPLREALQQFALETNIQVVYGGEDVVRGLNAPAVKGEFAAEMALQKLLAGSGLEYSFVNAQMVSIKRGAIAPAVSGVQIELAPHMAGKVIDLKVITVTGTNLRNIDPASPVIMIDAGQIESAGYSSIEDVLRHLPQSFSSRTSTGAAMGETEYGDSFMPKSSLGATSVNLRGLGSRSTLVLVNGRRLAGSAQGQGAFTDISSIPLSQVERVEVLTDGASAIYGADAVAGVINIVLKENYEGSLVQLRHETSSTDADQMRLDLAHTFGWENGFLTVAGSLRKSKAADANRFIHIGPEGAGDFTDLGGLFARTRNVGQPGVVFEALDDGTGMWLPGDAIGRIPDGQNGTQLQPGSLLPYDPVTAPSMFWPQRIGPKVTTPALRIAGEQNFAGDLKLSYSGSYTRQRNEEYWHPGPADFNFLQYGVTTLVPTNNVHNNFGRDVLVGYSYAQEFAGMALSQKQQQTNTNAFVGLSGKLPWSDNWDFDISYSDSRERGRSDELSGNAGLWDSGLDPAIDAFMENINPFGDGRDAAVVQANRELLNALVQRYESRFDSRLNNLDLLTRGDLFKMPGGQAQLALGGQLRNERYHMESTFGGASVADAERRAESAFAELGLPLLKDAAWAKELTLSLATRYDRFKQDGTTSLVNYAYDYDPNTGDPIDLIALGGFDMEQLMGAPLGDPYAEGPQTALERRYSSTSRQARLAWRPADALRLRATWGQSFLTPDVQQQFGRGDVNVGTYAVLFGGGQLPPGVSHIIQLTGPNPNLKPQTATTRTLGFDYNPGFINGLTLSVTYNDTRFDNYIGDPLAGLSYADIFADISKMPQEVFKLGDNDVLLWDARQINFLGRRSRTVDVNVDYGFDNVWGDWRLRVNAVRTLALEARSLPSFPVIEFSDSEYGPSKWAGDVLLSWNRGAWSASVSGNYSSSFRVLHPLSAEPNFYNDWVPNNLNPRRHASSYATVDLQVGYDWQQESGWLKGASLRLGVQNAFNREFPFVDNQYGFISNRVNVRGRVLYLDLKKEF